MMPLKIKNLKFMNKSLSIITCITLLVCSQLTAQEIIEDKKEEIKTIQVDSTQLIKVDGVAAVVGDFVVLDSSRTFRNKGSNFL